MPSPGNLTCHEVPAGRAELVAPQVGTGMYLAAGFVQHEYLLTRLDLSTTPARHRHPEVAPLLAIAR